MRRATTFQTLGVAALALLLGLAGGGVVRAQPGEVEEESWPAECDPAAQPYLEHGWFLLHSFEFEWAREEFMTASAIDSECAMAFAGEALSFNPPLWEKPPKKDLALGWSAIQRAQEAGKGSEVDQVFIDYVELLFKTYEKVPRRSRNIAFHNAIQRLWRTRGRSVEVGAYYGLSILTINVDSPNPNLARRREAADALGPYYKGHPDHPGVALYMVHALDASPELAQQGLDAAKRVVQIAPDLPNMRHVPARIYVRLGMWHEALEATLAADRASLELMETLDWPPERRFLRNAEWKIYTLIQSGRIAEARSFLEEIDDLVDYIDTAPAREIYKAMRVRFLVDGRQWDDAMTARSTSQLQVDKIMMDYVNVVSAAFLGKTGTAHRARARLKRYGPVIQERMVGEAAVGLAEENLAGVHMMKRIIHHEEQNGSSPFMPERGMPLRELYGEMLLRLGEPELAAEQFELSLKRFARRPGAILGLARAASALGDSAEATARLAEFYEIQQDADANAPLILEANRLPEAQVEAND